MSGYTDDVVLHHGVLDPALAFLQKPFSTDTLLTKIRDVIDAQVSPAY
jgi:FixJ family two-component response regulator